MQVSHVGPVARWSALLCWIGAAVAGAQAPLPAFPGAEGFGSDTPGGRGGDIVRVENLNDAGPGSLRWALEEEEGPRIVVFGTGGTVELSRPIVMAGEAASYVTIAGQTAPGGGLQLKNFGIWVRDGAHDIVIRHLRLRPGAYLPGAGHDMDVDGLELFGNDGRRVHHIVLDHVSFEWGLDENASAWRWVEDVTFQWCIIAETATQGQNGHPGKGVLVGGGGSHSPDRFTFHHNLLAHNHDRSPKVQYALTDFRNNVIYNWGNNNNSKFGTPASDAASRPTRVNLVNNLWKKGPSSNVVHRDVAWLKDDAAVFVDGNWGPRCPQGCAEEWEIGLRFETAPYPAADASRFQAARAFPHAPVFTHPTALLEGVVLSGAGATRPARDEVDARIVRDVEQGTGTTGAGSGYPDLTTGRPAPDDDGDGMANAWEGARGLDPQDPEDRLGDIDGNGYSNVEDYLNELAGDDVPAGPQTLVATLVTAGETVADEGDAIRLTSYPNPFNGQITIAYELSTSVAVRLSVFNLEGKRVRRLVADSDRLHDSVHWDGTDDSGKAVAAGSYVIRLQAGDVTRTRKVQLLK